MGEMMLGMLWFDNDPKKSLEQKIERAAAFYRDKYHTAATYCYLNSATMNGNKDLAKVGNVILVRSKMVLVNHFWIGGAMLIDGYGYKRKEAKDDQGQN